MGVSGSKVSQIQARWIMCVSQAVVMVVNTKLFIHKNWIESWHCRSNPGSNMWASCHPTIQSQCFLYLDCIFLGLLTMATLGHSVQIEYMKNTQGHMLRSIPVVHSGNSTHACKRTHHPICGILRPGFEPTT